MVLTLFFLYSIPETKGLSLEQVDDLYQNSTILGSDRYRRQILSDEAEGISRRNLSGLNEEPIEVRDDKLKEI